MNIKLKKYNVSSKVPFFITMLFILSLTFVTSLTFAEDGIERNDICDYLMNDLGAKEGGILPKGMPFGNERINFYSNSKSVGHIITENKIISSIGCMEINISTFKITIKDIDTIKVIADADSIADAFDNALSKGDLKAEGQKTSKKVKGFFTRVGIKLASWFS